MKVREVVFQKFVEVQRKKTDLSGLCKSIIRGGTWKWVSEWVALFCISIQFLFNWHV